MPVKEFNVTMHASSGIMQARGEAKDNILRELHEGQIDLRIIQCPDTPGVPKGTYLWGVVERFPNGDEQILIGGAKSSILEASVVGSGALETILKQR